MYEKIKMFESYLKEEEKAENTIMKYVHDIKEFYSWLITPHNNRRGEACEPEQSRRGEACEPEQSRRGELCEPIFTTRNGTPIDRKQIWQMLKKLAHKSGVPKEKVFPHNLRHLFAHEFYKSTHDIVKLA